MVSGPGTAVRMEKWGGSSLSNTKQSREGRGTPNKHTGPQNSALREKQENKYTKFYGNMKGPRYKDENTFPKRVQSKSQGQPNRLRPRIVKTMRNAPRYKLKEDKIQKGTA